MVWMWNALKKVGSQSTGPQLAMLFGEDLKTSVGEPRLESVTGLLCPFSMFLSARSWAVLFCNVLLQPWYTPKNLEHMWPRDHRVSPLKQWCIVSCSSLKFVLSSICYSRKNGSQYTDLPLTLEIHLFIVMLNLWITHKCYCIWLFEKKLSEKKGQRWQQWWI